VRLSPFDNHPDDLFKAYIWGNTIVGPVRMVIALVDCIPKRVRIDYTLYVSDTVAGCCVFVGGQSLATVGGADSELALV
jgi:hypothetical protein